VLIAIHTKK